MSLKKRRKGHQNPSLLGVFMELFKKCISVYKGVINSSTGASSVITGASTMFYRRNYIRNS